MIGVGLSNFQKMAKPREKVFYTKNGQTEFEFGYSLANGILLFVDGYKANPNYTILGSKIIFEEPFFENTQVIIVTFI